MKLKILLTLLLISLEALDSIVEDFPMAGNLQFNLANPQTPPPMGGKGCGTL